MAGWVPPRLRPLVGRDLAEITSAGIERLVGLPEDSDLDFKERPYGTTTGDSKEAAYDMACFANANGGLLVIGMEEDGGVAVAVRPIGPLAYELGLWLDQVNAARIFPNVIVKHRPIPVATGDVHVVSIAPSVVRPHAVEVGDGALRYPIRSGTTRRNLAESEIADAYRRRFTYLTEQGERAALLQSTGVYLTRLSSISADWGWLILSCVPDSPGALDLRRGIVTEWHEWLNMTITNFPGYGRESIRLVAAGFRRLEFQDVFLPDPMYAIGGQLNLDGAGVVVLGQQGGRGTHRIPKDVMAAFDEHLVADVVNGVSVLAQHAQRCGASGYATFSAQLLSHRDPMVLASYRARYGEPGVMDDTRRINGTTGISHHTASLDSISAPSPDVLAISRMLVGDLTSAFGLVEPHQITQELQLVRSAFQQAWHQRLDAWAAAAGVETTETQ